MAMPKKIDEEEKERTKEKNVVKMLNLVLIRIIGNIGSRKNAE